jgi:hypothetical protein
MNQFIQWLLGCLFGMIAGWLITWEYYTHKMRQLRIQSQESYNKGYEGALDNNHILHGEDAKRFLKEEGCSNSGTKSHIDH